MKLLFLGAASGLGTDLSNFQSNMIILTDTGKKLLIDCGTDIRFSLANAKYQADDVDAVYISHLHADHVGGLEWFALQRKFVSQKILPELLVHEKLAPLLWERSLSGGLKTLEDQEATLDAYFRVQRISDSKTYSWEGVQLDLIKTIHIHSNGHLMPSYGLDINHNDHNYLITTDTQFTPDIWEKYYQKAELIFHDCETLDTLSGVHAHFEELVTLPPNIKAKMWLYHYNDGELPDARAAGFRGFIQCGQTIDLA